MLFPRWKQSIFGGGFLFTGLCFKARESKETSGASIEPYSAKILFSEAFEQPPPTAQLLTLEGRFVGRGGEVTTPFDGILRKFRVETGAIQVWLVSEYSRTLLPEVSHGQFYRDKTYVIRWSYKLIYSK